MIGVLVVAAVLTAALVTYLGVCELALWLRCSWHARRVERELQRMLSMSRHPSNRGHYRS